jgi:hypothetical protein
MTDTLKLTRRGWIGHLAVVQDMLESLEEVYRIPTHRSVIGPKDCELDRRKKISKKFLELRELLWETSAVSEKILRELAARDGCETDKLEGLCVEPWAGDEEAELAARNAFDEAAKELEQRARSLWDKDAPEIVSPEVVYPGGEGADDTQPPQPSKEDPRQQTFDLTVPGGEPPRIRPEALIDYKMQQANDDTNTPDKPEDEE